MQYDYQSPWFTEALKTEDKIIINQLKSEEIADICIVGGGYTGLWTAINIKEKNPTTNVTLIEKDSSLGGVCLNRGCIPSKTLLHLSKVINDAQSLKNAGIEFSKLNIDVKKIQIWKNRVIKKLSGGIKLLAKNRNVHIMTGNANFISDKSIKVTIGNE